MFVDAKRVACEGEGLTECLRTKDAPDASWLLFYRTIEGFTFEPGHLYELTQVTEVKGALGGRVVPADRLSIEIVSKKRVP